MSKEFFVPELQKLGKASSIIFREHVAPSHFSRDVRQHFDNVFPNR